MCPPTPLCLSRSVILQLHGDSRGRPVPGERALGGAWPGAVLPTRKAAGRVVCGRLR